jgi:hypothetical protein
MDHRRPTRPDRHGQYVAAQWNPFICCSRPHPPNTTTVWYSQYPFTLLPRSERCCWPAYGRVGIGILLALGHNDNAAALQQFWQAVRNSLRGVAFPAVGDLRPWPLADRIRILRVDENRLAGRVLIAVLTQRLLPAIFPRVPFFPVRAGATARAPAAPL